MPFYLGILGLGGDAQRGESRVTVRHQSAQAPVPTNAGADQGPMQLPLVSGTGFEVRTLVAPLSSPELAQPLVRSD
jgi:hypothetical protein